MIRCRALGPVELDVDGDPPPKELLWRKNLALLLYLARSPKRTRTRDHLIALLWGDKSDSSARHSLNEALRILRKCVGKDGLISEGDRVSLSSGAVRLDLDEFDEHISTGDVKAAGRLALGEFLEGFHTPGSSEFEDWLSSERFEWKQRSVDVLVGLSETLLAEGNAAAAADVARRALRLDATSEAAVRRWMRCLVIVGDRTGALEIYERHAARLAEEFDIEPEEESQALAAAVRRERQWRTPEAAGVGSGSAGADRRTPLVGRERELGALLAVWIDCISKPRAALAVVEGDPGTGKTRLLEELTARARLDGGETCELRAVEGDLSVEWSGLSYIAAKLGAELAAVMSQEDVTIQGAALDAIRSAVSERPLMIVVDDAHWLDRSSLLALGVALRDLESSPLAVVLATESHPARPELDELRARIGRESAGTALKLSAIPGAAIRQLARWALPTYSDEEIDRVARRVATDSAGLPFLVTELLGAVALGMDIGLTDGAWPEPLRTLDQTLPGQLPDSIRAAIRVGFRRLSGDAQAVLIAAAVVGGSMGAEMLGLATELSRDALEAALDELEWNRWLAADSRGYSFVAHLVRGIVDDDMVLAGQRRRIKERLESGA